MTITRTEADALDAEFYEALFALKRNMRPKPLPAGWVCTYRARDDKDGHENTLYGYKVPGYEYGPGKDRGMFPRV